MKTLYKDSIISIGEDLNVVNTAVASDGGTVWYQILSNGVIIDLYCDGRIESKERSVYWALGYPGKPSAKKIERQSDFKLIIEPILKKQGMC